MGCASSGMTTNNNKTRSLGTTSKPVYNNDQKQNGLENSELAPCLALSEKDKELIMASWDIAVADISKIGVIAFTRYILSIYHTTCFSLRKWGTMRHFSFVCRPIQFLGSILYFSELVVPY